MSGKKPRWRKGVRLAWKRTLPRAGALAGLLLLPLAVPLLIFGASASVAGGVPARALEAAVSLMLVAGAPFVAGAAIRAGRT